MFLITGFYFFRPSGISPETFSTRRNSVRRLISCFVTLVCLNTPNAEAKIVEQVSMAEALGSATLETLVILDLDSTVIETSQMLGSDSFFQYLLELAHARGKDRADALQWALAENSKVQPYSPVHTVESETPALIRRLQVAGIKVIALTARPGDWATPTLAQLKSVGVDFTPTAIGGHWGHYPEAGRFEAGVFFVDGGVQKGPALLTFLSAIGFRPVQVLFVDDKAKNVESVDQSLRSVGVPALNVRYGGADGSIARFRPEIADCQWSVYKRYHVFISDEAAENAIEYGKCS